MIPFADGFSLDAFSAFFSSYGVFAPFFLGIAEEVVFFIPSALLFFAMGFVLVPADAPFGQALAVAFGQIIFPAAFGVALGAGLIYVLSYFGGKPAILSFGRYFGIRWQDIERIRRFFGRGYADDAVLVILRAIPVFPISVVSVFCGIIRIRPLSFFVTTFIGSVIRIGILSLAGWYAGREYAAYAEQVAGFERYFTAGIVLVLIIVLLLHLTKLKPKS